MFDGDYASLTNTPTLFDGDYANLTNKPTLFDGDYANLTNKPTLFDGDYASLTNTPTLFDGDYTSLTNKPELEDGKIYIGDSNNNSIQRLVNGDVTISNTGITSIGAQKVTNSMIADDAVGLDELANISSGTLLTGDSSNNPLLLDAKGLGKIIVGNGTGIASVSIGGVVNLASNGDVSIVDDAISYDKIQNIATANRVLGSINAGGDISEVQVATDMIADNAVNLSTKVAGTLPIANGGTGGSTASAALNSLGIISGIHIWDASPSTSQTVLLSGVSSSSIIVVTMNGAGNNQFLKNVVPGSGQFIINMNGDPGDGTKFSYIVINP